jgi:hypothetical protein
MLNQIYENRQKILLSILLFIVSLGGFSLLYSVFNPRFDIFTCLSGLSSFFIAILTVLYVLVTSNQLDLMAKQLDEMKKGRELQNQPFPWVNQIEMKLEKPRFYMFPQNGKCRAISRYWLTIDVKNIGSSPAVCIHALSILEIPSEKETIVYKSITSSIAALEEKSNSPLYENDIEGKLKQNLSKEDTLRIHFSCADNGIFRFIFIQDYTGMLLKSVIIPAFYKQPKLIIRILYKNVLGGCFELHNEHGLDIRSLTTVQTFENWSSQIILSDTNFHDELQEIDSKKNFEERHKLFDQMQGQFQKQIVGNDFEELDVVPADGRFSIKPVSEEEYNKALKDISGILEEIVKNG